MLKIKKNVILAPYTTFRIGGPAKYFVEVENEKELLEALKYAQENNLEFFILGGGSNILVSDKGFNGIVIYNRITNYELRITENKLECGAGLQLSRAVKLVAENSLSGLEWAAGIPGTIGGAIRGNAGAFGSAIADSIESVKAIEISNSPNYLISDQIPSPKSQIPNKFKILNYKKSDCKFSYRNSIFKQNQNLIILSCVLKLQKANKGEIMAEINENIRKRLEKQPKELSVGSFFKNPLIEDKELIKKFELDQELKCKDNKIPAGWLIRQAGLSGKKIGGAMVSEKHANFIVNAGDATAEDVIMLVSLIKQQVRDKFGIELNEEVQYVGFN
jgi:UDP-N-acetylmuramate dehydrogenase